MARWARSIDSGAFRFALLFAAVFACASFLLLGMVRHQVGRYAHQATVGALRTETDTLIAEAPPGRVGAIARRIAASPKGAFQYLLLDAQGERLIGTIPVAMAKVGWSAVVMREMSSTPQHLEPLERLVTLGTATPDGGLLVVATDAYDVERLGGHMIRFTIAWAIAITLMALGGGWLAGRFFLARLAAVNLAIDGVMAGRIEQRLPMIGLAPELDDLARNLNRMLDRIDGLMSGLRQVSTDVAHDLRTPLTRLRQMLEAAREADDPATIGVRVEGAIEQTDQLLATFRAILRLAQIEGGGRRATFGPVDLGAIVSGLVETYDPVAADAGHALVPPAAIDAEVDGDGELLAQLFANLIENAIIHTPPGTRVRIGIERAGDQLVVSVSDDGPGVLPAERSRLTRRFYQVDPSRSGGGAGLGLAMAEAIATLHAAKLTVDDASPGLRVSITFPERRSCSAISNATRIAAR